MFHHPRKKILEKRSLKTTAGEGPCAFAVIKRFWISQLWSKVFCCVDALLKRRTADFFDRPNKQLECPQFDQGWHFDRALAPLRTISQEASAGRIEQLAQRHCVVCRAHMEGSSRFKLVTKQTADRGNSIIGRNQID